MEKIIYQLVFSLNTPALKWVNIFQQSKDENGENLKDKQTYKLHKNFNWINNAALLGNFSTCFELREYQESKQNGFNKRNAEERISNGETCYSLSGIVIFNFIREKRPVLVSLLRNFWLFFFLKCSNSTTKGIHYLFYHRLSSTFIVSVVLFLQFSELCRSRGFSNKTEAAFFHYQSAFRNDNRQEATPQSRNVILRLVGETFVLYDLKVVIKVI